MYEMKNTLNEINIRLDIPERKKKKRLENFKTQQQKQTVNNKTNEQMNGLQIGREEIKLPLFTVNMIVYSENSTELITNTLGTNR